MTNDCGFGPSFRERATANRERESGRDGGGVQKQKDKTPRWNVDSFPSNSHLSEGHHLDGGVGGGSDGHESGSTGGGGDGSDLL